MKIFSQYSAAMLVPGIGLLEGIKRSKTSHSLSIYQ